MSHISNLKLKFKLVLENEYVRAEVDEKRKLIYIVWLQHPRSEVFRPLFNELVKLSQIYQIEYWLSDARAIHYLEFSDQNWLLQDIAPFLKTTTVKKFARVTTQEGFAMMDVTRIYDTIEQLADFKVETEFESFFSMDAALEWLFDDELNQDL